MWIAALIAHMVVVYVLPLKTWRTRYGVHAVIVYVLLGAWNPVWALALSGVHAAIEVGRWLASLRWWGVDGERHATARRLAILGVAEVLHAVGALAMLQAASGLDEPVLPWWMAWGDGDGAWAAWVALGYVVLIWLGSAVIRTAIAPFEAQLAETRGEAMQGLRDAGRVIGWLESTIIYVLVLSGNAGGVGFLIAAKSIFRFGELKDAGSRRDAEYFLIGTLMSVAWSLGVSVVVAGAEVR